MIVPLRTEPNGVVYPLYDGKPMSDDPKQSHWIVMLAGEITPDELAELQRLTRPRA